MYCPLSCNYNATSNVDDGSCYGELGFTDSLSNNYNSFDIVDDGTFTCPTICTKPVPTGLYIDNIIHTVETYRGQSRTWFNPTAFLYRSASWTSLIFWTQPSSIRQNGIEDSFLFDIYPNPNRGAFDVRISNVDNHKMQLYIYIVLFEKIK